MEQYMKSLLRKHTMTTELKEKLHYSLIPTHFKKEMIVDGSIVFLNSLVFIEKGLLRLYRYDDDKEITMAFKMENQWLMAQQVISEQIKIIVHTLEDTILWQLPQPMLEELDKDHEIFIHHGRIIAEQERLWSHMEKIARIKGHPFEMYRHLFETAPDLLNRVPLEYLASYAGTSKRIFKKYMKNPPPPNTGD